MLMSHKQRISCIKPWKPVLSVVSHLSDGLPAKQTSEEHMTTTQMYLLLYLSCKTKRFGLMLQAIQCLGGNGYINEYATGRLLRDAKLYEIGAGTSEIRRIVIGRELFKEQ